MGQASATKISAVSNQQSWPNFIYITGCDGTGKTTQVSILQSQMEESGTNPLHLWLRFPFFFSLPLLVYARLRKFSWHEEEDGIRHGYWDFRRSRLLLLFFPWTLLLDAALAAVRRVLLPIWKGQSIVCERFVLDMLVDLSVAFDDPSIHQRSPGRFYRRLIPDGARIIILDLDATTIRERRTDLQSDWRLEERLRMYRTIASDYSITTLSSSLPISRLHQKIMASVMG